MANELTLDDIADQRAYERERPEFLARVRDMKNKRRVHVGNITTFMFENRDTMRLQIQEMARVEKISSDERIEEEIRIYNELIPTRNELKATLMIELVTEEELRTWLPKLPGIQDHIHLTFGELKVTAYELGEDRLSREDEMTTTVHYMNFSFTDEQREAFLATGDEVRLLIDHPEYQESTVLSSETIEQLQNDLN